MLSPLKDIIIFRLRAETEQKKNHYQVRPNENFQRATVVSDALSKYLASFLLY